MTKIGTGWVAVDADFGPFWRGVDREMSGFDRRFKQVGQSAGKGFSAGFSAGRASRELDEVRGSLSGVDRESRKAAKGMAGLTAAAGGSGGGLRNASRGMSAFGGAAAGATATIGGFRVALAALVPLTIGFGGAAVSVVSALGPLAGLAAAAGNALGAAAQGMAAFKLATMGVADALKEQVDKQMKSASAAISNAAAQRSAARAIQSAQDGIRNATERLDEALRDERLAVAALGPAYTAARMRLNDLREAVVDANLALRGAKLAADEARRALAELLAGPDPRELADAHHAISQAVRGQTEAVRDLTDAQQAYVDLFKPADALDVADATDAVTDAVRNEERARLNLNDQIAQTNAILADPTATDDQKARARLDLADAENSVGDSTRATARARERLAELEGGPSQAAIETARRRISDAEHAVAEAARGTATARAELAEIEAPIASAEIAAARHNIALAENALGDAQRDRTRAVRALAEADRLGIEGAEEVVAAREQVRQASMAVANAERDMTRATQALSDAQLAAKESMAQMGLAAASLDEKMNKLPPAAREFVRELISMKPRLDELRNTAAQGFFPGATEGLRAAMGSFSEVNQVVGQTSTVLGEAARKSGELVGSPAFGKDIAIIGGNNARVIDTLGEALRHVVSAIRHVMVAAGPLTQWLADVINKWALNAAGAAKSGRETGKLAAFFERTRDVAERLGSIIGHLASGFIGVGKAGSTSGNTILKSIDKAAKRFDEWANSVAGRREIQDFFQSTKDLAAALIPVIAGVSGGVAFFVLKLAPLTAALEILGPLADEATIAFIAYKFATYGVAAASTAAKVAVRAWAAAQWLLNSALLANPITWIVLAVAGLVAAFIYAYKNSEDFRRIVDGALRAVGDAFTWMWNAAKDVFNWLKENWPIIRDVIVNPIIDTVTAIATNVGNIIGFFRDLPGNIVDAIKAGASFIIDAGKWIVHRVTEGVKAVVGFAADVGGWLKNRLVEGIHATIDTLKAVGTWILNRIVDGFKFGSDLLRSVGGWLKNRFEEFIRNSIEGWKAIGTWVLNRVVDGFKAGADAVGSAGGWLRNRLTEGIHAVGGAFKDLGGWIIDKIVDGLKGGANLIVGFVNKIIGVIEDIPGIGDLPRVKKFAEGGEIKKQGFAKGGAFARTGGVVASPIVLMGEEAPNHPEFVIPTNPAYRDRAQMLLMRAAKAIGLAEGGVVSAFNQAVKSTGASAKPALALFEAGVVESGLRNLPYGDRDSRGSLQVRDSTARGMGLNNMDPRAVARAFLTRGYWGKGSAIGLAAHNRGATAGWIAQQVQGSAYPSRYDAARDEALKYMTGDVKGEGGILSTITGALGDLLSKGASFILDKLPGTGDLPGWLKGTGRYILEHVGDWIKDKVSDIIGLGGGSGAVSGGVTGSIKGAMALARKLGLTITSTTGGNHAQGSWHYKGRAADVAGTPGQMAAFFNAALQRYGSHLLELFYDPLGAIDNGKRIPAIGGHSDHVHIALARGGIFGAAGLPPYGGSFATGGIVPGPTGSARLIEAHAGEVVMPNGMQLHADIYIGGQRINELVDVRLEVRDRQRAGQWDAGVLR